MSHWLADVNLAAPIAIRIAHVFTFTQSESEYSRILNSYRDAKYA